MGSYDLTRPDGASAEAPGRQATDRQIRAPTHTRPRIAPSTDPDAGMLKARIPLPYTEYTIRRRALIRLAQRARLNAGTRDARLRRPFPQPERSGAGWRGDRSLARLPLRRAGGKAETAAAGRRGAGGGAGATNGNNSCSVFFHPPVPR